jgi:dihydrofolate synthase / folylpolyglutamate synthase
MRTLAEWLALQESVHPKTIDMDLVRVTAVARALGVDKPACPVITVGGTNGKGSTVAHLEALLRAAGASTGTFTSPHLIRYNERIRVDGVEVDDAELVAAFERIEGARGTTTLTFFEYNTLAALLIFAERAVDVEVLEVGLGGRLDATNLVGADVAVVCSIGFDHREWLGESLELIGAEKAGIFRSGRPAVLGTPDMPPSVFSKIRELGARAVVAGKDFTWRVAEDSVDRARWSYDGLGVSLRDLPPSALGGSIQYRNAATAIAAVTALGWSNVNERSVGEALRTVRLAGRFHIVPGPVRPPREIEHCAPSERQPTDKTLDFPGTPVEWILDIAHNEPAAEIFAMHVRERPLPQPQSPPPLVGPGRSGKGRTFAVVGILEDKDVKAIARALEPLVDHWIACSLPGPRGLSAEELARRLQLSSGDVTLASSVEAGCEFARATAKPGDRVIVFGSFYTVGPALQWLRIY